VKKVLLIIATILLSVSIIGCSSSSKKYDDDINKIIEKINKNLNENVPKYERKNMNIKVYENVDVNAGAVQGKKTLYAIQKKKDNDYEFYFIKDTDGKVDEFGAGWDKRISEVVSKPVYEEINIK
jgi:lipoprotein